MLKILRSTFGSLFLILICPPFVMLMWYTNTELEGSLARLCEIFFQKGFFYTIYDIWQPLFFGSPTAWFLISIFILFEFTLLHLLPGKLFYGPLTPKGNRPLYKANGIWAFLITLSTFSLCGFYWHLFSPTIIFDHFGEILGALNGLSLLFCAFLYIKGRFFPSSSDSGITGNLIFDYYWGTELYPKALGTNIKMFINCRFGMMSWGIIVLSYAAKQSELYGLSNSMMISVALQLFYITKFFIWEPGYLASLDIIHDRAGFYICWGCLVWVPGIYTSPAQYLVHHPNDLSNILTITIFGLGIISILVNFLADRQRQLVRNSEGNCKIWGKPPKLIKASYYTELGEQKQNLILSSGWWGIARHFHYLPEIAAAFFWSVPALFMNFSPYFYLCFLTILLIDRSFRDDKRCSAKYGEYWEAYCQSVPYKIIPFVL